MKTKLNHGRHAKPRSMTMIVIYAAMKFILAMIIAAVFSVSAKGAGRCALIGNTEVAQIGEKTEEDNAMPKYGAVNCAAHRRTEYF